MDRPRRRLGAELLLVALSVACLAGSLATIVAIHRRPTPPPPGPSTAPIATIVPPPAPRVVEAPKPRPEPVPEPVPAPVAVADPTKPIVAELAAAEAEQRVEAERANRRAGAIEAAALAARAEADRWKRGLALAYRQLDTLGSLARQGESRAETAVMERDALAKRRDALKSAIEADRGHPAGYAVLPHRGPNGTWQRPIVIECKDGRAALRPNGPAFSLAEITSPFGLRSNPFVAAVAREAVRVQRQTSPDGETITPYIFFIIRPDGIRPYYEARARLERLGVAFGYELADAGWTIDVPDLDRPSAWDGSTPTPNSPDDPVASSIDGPGAASLLGTGRGAADNPFVWPTSPPGLGREAAAGGGREAVGFPGESGRPGSPGEPGLGGEFPVGDRGRPGGSLAEGSSLVGHDPMGDAPGRSPRGRPFAGTLNDPGTPGRAGLTPFPTGPSFRGGGPAAEPASGGSGNRAFSLDDSNRPVGLRALPLGRGDEPTDGPAPGSGRDPGRPGTGRGSSASTGGSNRVAGLAAAGTGGGTTPSGRDGGAGSGSGAGGAGSGTGAGAGGAGSSGGGSQGGAAGSGGGGEGGDASGSGQPAAATGVAGGMRGGSAGFGQIARPFELVLACGPKGVAVHPGDYRVTASALKSADPLLVPQLKALVRHKENALPGVTVVPTLRYVIEPGGQLSYATARGQVAVSGIEWPATIQVSGGDILRLYSTDSW